MLDVIKNAMHYSQNYSIDWCFEKVFQNALDKRLLTDRFTINQKIQKYKRNTKIQNMYIPFKCVEKL